VLPAAAQQPPDLGLYASVLSNYVRDDGRVDYGGIKANPGPLKQFVAQLASVSPDSHPRLFPSREAKLAYWINAYNALVLHAFSREYPEKKNRLKGTWGKAQFFYRMKHDVGGHRRSLDDIESNSIRQFGDPRIHFAIVCASASCPWLSREPYTAANLETKLEAESQRYFRQSRNFKLDALRREVWLPEIFKWFKADFGAGDGEVLRFVARYRPAESSKLTSGGWKVRYFPYDWSPND
jgi:hypothetical protein